MASSQPTEPEELYTIDEMAALLKISKKSIYNKIHLGKSGEEIPPMVKLGGLVRFKRTDYLNWYSNLC